VAHADQTTCPQCGQKLYGLVETCFKCGHKVDLALRRREAVALEAEHRESRRRGSWWYRLWFGLKFGALAARFAAGRATLHDAEPVGDSKLAVGNVQFRIVRLGVAPFAGDAWEAVKQRPAALRVALTCRACARMHVVRVTGSGGDIASRLERVPIGRFHDRYLASWSAPWFQLVRPELAGALGAGDVLRCQSCRAEGRPRTTLY
jgi:hypothetical protein